jgi:hypothetical protein
LPQESLDEILTAPATVATAPILATARALSTPPALAGTAAFAAPESNERRDANHSNFAVLSFYASKMTVVSLALSGAAMLSMLALGHAVNVHKLEKVIVESKQQHILPAANAEIGAVSQSKEAKLRDFAENRPFAVKSSRRLRMARKHSTAEPTPMPSRFEPSHNEKGGEVHRHAYSTYWEGD